MILLLSPLASACPLCHTEIGEQVRGKIFNSSFPLILLETAAPFIIFMIIAFVLHFGWPTKRSMSRGAVSRQNDV
ncbi:MAG: hypothetical protein ABI041_11040 [Bdellovibrionia bacterium]